MRLGVTLCAAVLALASAAPVLALDPGPATIRITAESISMRHSTEVKRVGQHDITTLHLFNKHIRPQAIGSEVLTCTYLGKGGVLGEGANWCAATYILPHGRLYGIGLRHANFYYQLSVVGGTGIYGNVMGTVTVSSQTRRSSLLLFALFALPY